MYDNEEQAKLGYRGGMTLRPRSLVAKMLSVVIGGVMLVSAFVLSIAFFAIALAFVLAVGIYFWWKTRDLRRQIREQMQGGLGAQDLAREARQSARGDVIEGVVISRKETSDQPRH